MRTLSAIGCLNLVLVTILAKPDVSHLVNKSNQSNRGIIDQHGEVTDHPEYTIQRIRKREANYDGDLRNSIPGEPGVDYPIYGDPPYSSFSCQERSDGYYADVEAQCQVFRVCANTDLTGNGFAFLCPNGTLFSQQQFVCDWYTNVDCQSSPNYYSMNAQVVRKITSHGQMMAAVKTMIEYPFRVRSTAAPGRGANSVQDTKYAPPGVEGNIPERTKVYISSLGELSTDFGVKFDPKKSKIIKDYPADTQPSNTEDDVITYGYPPRRNSRTNQSSRQDSLQDAGEKPKQIYTYPTQDEDKSDQETKESQLHETAHLLNNFFLYNEEPKDDSRVLQRILDLRKQSGRNLEAPIPDDIEEPNLSSILHSSPLEINSEFLSIRANKMYQYDFDEDPEAPKSEPSPTVDPFIEGLQLSVVDTADAGDPIHLAQRHLKPTLVPNLLTFNNDLTKENSASKSVSNKQPQTDSYDDQPNQNESDVNSVPEVVPSPKSLPSTEYIKKQQIIAMARAASKEKAKGLINERDHTNVANILRAHSAVEQLQSDEHAAEEQQDQSTSDELMVENVTTFEDQFYQSEDSQAETEPTYEAYETESPANAEYYNYDVEVNTEVEPLNETDYSQISISHNTEAQRPADVEESVEKTVVNLEEADPETTTLDSFYVTEENDHTEQSDLSHEELMANTDDMADELDPTDQGLQQARLATVRKVIVDSVSKEYENEKRDISSNIGDVRYVSKTSRKESFSGSKKHVSESSTYEEESDDSNAVKDVTAKDKNPTLDEQERRIVKVGKHSKSLNININEPNSYSFGGARVETFKEPVDNRGSIKFTDEKFKYLTSIVLKPGALKTIITLEHPLSLAPIVVPDEEDEEYLHNIETREEADVENISNSVDEYSQTAVTEDSESVVDNPEDSEETSYDLVSNDYKNEQVTIRAEQILEDRIELAREMLAIDPEEVAIASDDSLPPEETATLYSEPDDEEITEAPIYQEISTESPSTVSPVSANNDTDISPELYELLANAVKWEKQQARISRANKTYQDFSVEQPLSYPQSLEFETTTKKIIRTTTRKPKPTSRSSSTGSSGYIGSLTSLLQGFFRNNFLTNNFQRLSGGGGGNSIRRNSVELSANENLIENLSDEKIESFVKYLDQKGIAKNLSQLFDETDDNKVNFDIDERRVVSKPVVAIKEDSKFVEIESLEKYRVKNNHINIKTADSVNKINDVQEDVRTDHNSFIKGFKNSGPPVKSSFDKYFQQQSEPSFQIYKSDDRTSQYFPAGNTQTAIDYNGNFFGHSTQSYATHDATNHKAHKKPLDQENSPNQRHESITAYNSIALVKPFSQANLPIIQSITKSVEAAHFTTIDNVPSHTLPTSAVPPVRENYPHSILNNHVTRYSPVDPLYSRHLQSTVSAHTPSIAYSQAITPSNIAYSHVFTPSIPSLPTGAQPRRYDPSQESGSEKVVVQIVPARGFFLNDPVDRKSYYEAVSQGLLDENGFVYVNNIQTDNTAGIQPRRPQQQQHNSHQQTTYPQLHQRFTPPQQQILSAIQLPDTRQRQDFRTKQQLQYQEEKQQANRRVFQETSNPSPSSGYSYERPSTPFVY